MSYRAGAGASRGAGADACLPTITSPRSISAGARLLVPPHHLPAPPLRDSCSIHTSEQIPQDFGWLAWAISHPISQSRTASYVWGSEWGSWSTPGQGWVPGGQSSNHRGVVLDAQQRCPLNPGRTQRWQAHQGSFGFFMFLLLLWGTNADALRIFFG